MDIKTLKAQLIPELNTYCQVPIIEADQKGDKPDGPHAVFKITSPFLKGVGQAEETPIQTADTYKIKRVESYRVAISFTSYAMDEEKSLELAQKLYDWFAFFGYEYLDAIDVVLVEQTEVSNRDAFVINDYERRNGFDVILELTREITKDVGYIETVEGITN